MVKVEVLKDSYFSLNPPSGKALIRLNGSLKGEEVLRAKEVDENIPYKLLNPIQSTFYRYYKGGNALISSPTSSGKSLIAYLFLKDLKGVKVLTAPTRSLVLEKAKELRELFKRKVELRSGDVLEVFKEIRSDVVVATYESLALSLRNKSPWTERLGGVVIDEVHHLFTERGVILEELIAHLLKKGCPLLGLSATLPDAPKIARFLRASFYLESSWRPVPLKRKFLSLKDFEPFTETEDKRRDTTVANKLLRLIFDLRERDRNYLVFVPKKNIGWKALELANREKIGIVNETLPFQREERQECEIAFHNADVPKEERIKIEKLFREGKLPILLATQTLAYGVNLPADCVIILINSFYDRMEREWVIMPRVIDIIQMEGRAGRFGIRDEGVSYLVAYGVKTQKLRELIKDLKYGIEERSRRNLELMILVGILYEGRGFKEFLKNTYTFKDLPDYLIKEKLEELEERGFLKDYKLTKKGEFCVKTNIPPNNLEEFLRRIELNLELTIAIRPLLFTKKFNSLFYFIKDMEGFDGDYDYIVAKLSPCGRPCFEDGTDEFLFYLEGLTFKYKNINHVPGEFSQLNSDINHLMLNLLNLVRHNLISLNKAQILKLAHSLKYGLTLDYSALGGIKGIGHIRANLLKRLLYKNSIKPPTLGEKVEKLLELLKDMDLEGELTEILLEDRGLSGVKARSEARKVIKLLERNKGGYLVDEFLLRAFAGFTLGKRALFLKKEELIGSLKEYIY